MSETLLDLLRKIEGLLTDAEQGACDPLHLVGPLWELAGRTQRAGWLIDRPCVSWSDAAFSARDGIEFAVQTGKSVEAELTLARKRLAPLFDVLSKIREAEECFA